MSRTAEFGDFTIEDGLLVMRVVPRPRHGVDRRPYVHTCLTQTLVDVAHAIDDLQHALFATAYIAEVTGHPQTQVNVACRFLEERGCIVQAHRRRWKGASEDVYLDAMTELSALREAETTSA